ncbi:hypothetical protein, partial [Longitalea arenae]|uniref:hypothetical protein n=1 Tax=Longitalea arenae TaxID=2812558 RepID=UPI0019675DD3
TKSMLLFLTPLCTLVANFCVLVVAKSSALLIAKNSALLLTDYRNTAACAGQKKKSPDQETKSDKP